MTMSRLHHREEVVTRPMPKSLQVALVRRRHLSHRPESLHLPFHSLLPITMPLSTCREMPAPLHAAASSCISSFIEGP